MAHSLLSQDRCQREGFWEVVDMWCLLTPFPNSSGWGWLISSVFLTRTSCPRITHTNGCDSAWSGLAVWVTVLPLRMSDLNYEDPAGVAESCSMCGKLTILCQKYCENKGKYRSIFPIQWQKYASMHFHLLYLTHLWRPRSNVTNSMKNPRVSYGRNLFFLYFPHCILISVFYCAPFALF